MFYYHSHHHLRKGENSSLWYCQVTFGFKIYSGGWIKKADSEVASLTFHFSTTITIIHTRATHRNTVESFSTPSQTKGYSELKLPKEQGHSQACLRCMSYWTRDVKPWTVAQSWIVCPQGNKTRNYFFKLWPLKNVKAPPPQRAWNKEEIKPNNHKENNNNENTMCFKFTCKVPKAVIRSATHSIKCYSYCFLNDTSKCVEHQLRKLEENNRTTREKI